MQQNSNRFDTHLIRFRYDQFTENDSDSKDRMAKLNLEILAYEDTELGLLCLRRRELLSQPGVVVTEVSLNNEFLMSSLYTDSEESLSRKAIELHAGNKLRVLVGGLGLGYTAAAALKSDRVASIEVVEFLPQVIQWTREGKIPLSDILCGDPRMSISHDDVYRRLATEPAADQQLFDLVLIDVDHSPDDRLGETNSDFYTKSGLQAARKHLATDGLLGVWSYAESSPFADALHSVFENVNVLAVTHQNELINQEHTDWLFFAS